MFPVSANKEYGPGEVCSWLDLSRTTLFRWESKGNIPAIERGPRDNRLYTGNEVFAIVDLVRDRIGDQIAERTRLGLPMMDDSLIELLYRTKVLRDPVSGLYQMRSLAEARPLSRKTSSLLIGAALNLPIGHEYRSAVWAIMIASDLRANASQ